MAWFLGQSLLFIVLAFVLGLLVGWLIWGRRRVVQTSLGGGSSAAATSGAPAVPAPASAPAIESDLESRSDSQPESQHSTVDTVGVGSSTVDNLDVGGGRAASSAGAESSEVESASVADFGLIESEPIADLEPVPGDFASASAALDRETDVESPFESESGARLGSEPVTLAAQPEPEPALVGAAAPSPAAVAGASGGAAAVEPDDDLKRIEGIGPKMSAALHAAGIRTFQQLSETDEPRLRAAIQAAGLRFAPSLVTWARQARLLADGDEDGFNVLTKQLIAGREARRD